MAVSQTTIDDLFAAGPVASAPPPTLRASNPPEDRYAVGLSAVGRAIARLKHSVGQ
ncbi:MAG: hypothetical protein V3W34_15215 [Phycisphaerae bacterium]